MGRPKGIKNKMRVVDSTGLVTELTQNENIGNLVTPPVTFQYVCKRSVNPPVLTKVLTSSIANQYFKNTESLSFTQRNILSVKDFDLKFSDPETFLLNCLRESKSPDGFIQLVRTQQLKSFEFCYRGLLSVALSVSSTEKNTVLTVLTLTVACSDGTYEISIPFEKE